MCRDKNYKYWFLLKTGFVQLYQIKIQGLFKNNFLFFKDWKLLLLWKRGTHEGGDLRWNCQTTFRHVLRVFHCRIKKYNKCLWEIEGLFKEFCHNSRTFQGFMQIQGLFKTSSQIDDFRVAFRLCFNAKSFIWKLVLFTCKWTKICMWIKLISIWKASH